MPYITLRVGWIWILVDYIVNCFLCACMHKTACCNILWVSFFFACMYVYKISAMYFFLYIMC